MSAPTASSSFRYDSGDDDLHAIAAEQRCELMAAKAVDSDLDFAFDLQLQEALTASLSLHPSTSFATAAQPQPKEEAFNFTDVLSDELLKLELELSDQAVSEREFRRLKNDLDLRLHDHRLALEISRIPEDEWEEWGDDFERPFGEGSSKGGSEGIFRIYFKGLVELQFPGETVRGGIGIAICDSRDDLLFELQKPIVSNGASRRLVEIQALIEALNAALELRLQRLAFYCDNLTIFNFIMSQRLREASIPVAEKVYCPYPKCSALMSKREALEFSNIAIVGAELSGARKCIKCSGHFCINCKVPWHNNMTCIEYKRRNPHLQQEEAKLKTLAATNLWRQCVKCNHMIELAAGCYHMTCRCGYEFCYTCGAEWKNKKVSCSCPLWDEEHILEDDFDSEDEDEDEFQDEIERDEDEDEFEDEIEREMEMGRETIYLLNSDADIYW